MSGTLGAEKKKGGSRSQDVPGTHVQPSQYLMPFHDTPYGYFPPNLVLHGTT